MEYNVYCDESCHLEHDGINVMTLGAIWCPKNKLKDINNRIKEIKVRNGVTPSSELKWTKVSPVKEQLYIDMIDYFFDDDDIHFRCLLVPNKTLLDHQRFNQTHDDWYYKMYFDMLKVIFSPVDTYDVYIDIKDTNSNRKAKKLHEICCNNAYDFSSRIIRKIQPIRSHETQIMQLVDILIGAIAFRNRYLNNHEHRSQAKLKLIQRIKDRSRYQLTKTTLLKEDKVNIFVWNAVTQETNND